MKALVSILESLEIDTAVSLDDDYDDKLSQYESIAIEDFSFAYPEIFSPDDVDLIYDAGIATIDDLLKSEVISVQQKEQVQAAIVKPELALTFLECGFQESSIQYHKICDINQMNDTTAKGTIWFVDKEMGDRDVLPEVIPNIVQHTCDAPSIIIVFTSDDSLCNLNSSWQKRFEYLTDIFHEEKMAKELAYSFFVISKKEIKDKLNYNEIAAHQYVEKILIDAFVGYCAFHVVSRIGSFAGKAYEHLLDIAKDSNRSTLETIHYNMVTEGEPNVYHAFKTIHNLMQEELYTTHFNEFEKHILAMKRATLLSNSSTRTRQQTIEDIVLQYNWAQYQFMHKDTNVSFSDIAYGDVFKLTYCDTPYIGILITQPCDCILRTDDKKTTERKAKTFTVLLYEKKTLSKEELPNKVKDIQNNGIFFEYEIIDQERKDWKIGYIDANKCSNAIQLPSFILDLTSVSVNGNAKLLLGQDLKDIIRKKKTENWSTYEPFFQARITEFQNHVKLLQEKVPNEAENILKLFYGIPFSLEKQEFSIERIGHLEPNLTELISYCYVSRTYRTGKNSLIALHNDEIDRGEV